MERVLEEDVVGGGGDGDIGHAAGGGDLAILHHPNITLPPTIIFFLNKISLQFLFRYGED